MGNLNFQITVLCSFPTILSGLLRKKSIIERKVLNKNTSQDYNYTKKHY